MKQRFLVICNFVLFIVSILLLFFAWHSHQTKNSVEYDTIHLRDTVVLDGPTKVETRIVEIPQKVDTAEIIRQFYMLNIYADTIKANEYVTIVVHDTVYNNSLTSQSFDVISDYPKMQPADNKALSVGFGTGRNIFNVGLQYRFKRMAVSGAYDFCQRSAVIGLKYDIITWK